MSMNHYFLAVFGSECDSLGSVSGWFPSVRWCSLEYSSHSISMARQWQGQLRITLFYEKSKIADSLHSPVPQSSEWRVENAEESQYSSSLSGKERNGVVMMQSLLPGSGNSARKRHCSPSLLFTRKIRFSLDDEGQWIRQTIAYQWLNIRQLVAGSRSDLQKMESILSSLILSALNSLNWSPESIKRNDSI